MILDATESPTAEGVNSTLIFNSSMICSVFLGLTREIQVWALIVKYKLHCTLKKKKHRHCIQTDASTTVLLFSYIIAFHP
jgi:hypothetical protein